MHRFSRIVLSCLLPAVCGFALPDEGNAQALLHTADDANKSADVAVQPSASPQSTITLSPSFLDFGTQFVGTRTSLMLTLYNNSTETAYIIALWAYPPFAPHPSVIEVAAGSSLDIPVTFAPTSAGTFTRDINFSFYGASSGTTYLTGTLSGTGVSPE